MIHTHNCQHCGTELTCCCKNKLQVDRLTGKPREFTCIPCMALGENIFQHFLEEAAKGETNAA